MTAYYNEFDPFAAAWLMQLIGAGHIAPGVVDTRSIEDVTPNDLRGFTQGHFFAGIGIWSLAARRAGWADDEPLWTGSCPCQPFSAAGKGGGFDDERHLWPAWYWLIAECRPERIAGEQVASSNVDPWLDLVQADLEGMDYAFGCVPSPSAGYGAPHIRDRAFWTAERMGDSDDTRLEVGRIRPVDEHGSQGRQTTGRSAGLSGVHDGLADADGRDARAEWQQPSGKQRFEPQDGRTGGVGDTDRADAAQIDPSDDPQHEQRPTFRRRSEQPAGARTGIGDGDGYNRTGRDAFGSTSKVASVSRPGPTNGLWRDADWLGCTDGKWRPVMPETFPLAHAGAYRNRVGTLRGAGNAINLAQATEWMRAIR